MGGSLRLRHAGDEVVRLFPRLHEIELIRPVAQYHHLFAACINGFIHHMLVNVFGVFLFRPKQVNDQPGYAAQVAVI